MLTDDEKGEDLARPMADDGSSGGERSSASPALAGALIDPPSATFRTISMTTSEESDLTEASLERLAGADAPLTPSPESEWKLKRPTSGLRSKLGVQASGGVKSADLPWSVGWSWPSTWSWWFPENPPSASKFSSDSFGVDVWTIPFCSCCWSVSAPEWVRGEWELPSKAPPLVAPPEKVWEP